jgi:hypothetical protein
MRASGRTRSPRAPDEGTAVSPSSRETREDDEGHERPPMLGRTNPPPAAPPVLRDRRLPGVVAVPFCSAPTTPAAYALRRARDATRLGRKPLVGPGPSPRCSGASTTGSPTAGPPLHWAHDWRPAPGVGTATPRALTIPGAGPRIPGAPSQAASPPARASNVRLRPGRPPPRVCAPGGRRHGGGGAGLRAEPATPPRRAVHTTTPPPTRQAIPCRPLRLAAPRGSPPAPPARDGTHPLGCRPVAATAPAPSPAPPPDLPPPRPPTATGWRPARAPSAQQPAPRGRPSRGATARSRFLRAAASAPSCGRAPTSRSSEDRSPTLASRRTPPRPVALLAGAAEPAASRGPDEHTRPGGHRTRRRAASRTRQPRVRSRTAQSRAPATRPCP